MNRIAAIVLALGLFLLGGAAILAQSLSDAPPQHFVTDETTPQTLTARFPDNAIVQVTINNEKLWFYAATEFRGFDIDRTAIKKDQIQADDKGQGLVDIAVGPFAARDCYFGAMDGWNALDGARVQGILGSPFFRSNVVTIDYVHHQVIAYPRGSFDPAKMVANAVPLGVTNELPIVHVAFGDKRATMLLATGYAKTLITEAFAKGVTLGPGSYRFRSAEYQGINPIPRRFFNTKPMGIGAYTIPHPFIAVDDDLPPWLKPLLIDGVLGRDVLKDFRITLDYANNVVYLER